MKGNKTLHCQWENENVLYFEGYPCRDKTIKKQYSFTNYTATIYPDK